MRTRTRRAGGDRGAVTVEAAIALFALVAVLALMFAGITAVADQLRCTDAAREAARLAARGEHGLAREAVARIAPSGATVRLNARPDGIEVTVLADPVGGLLPGVRLRGEAFAVPEPGIGAADAEPADPGGSVP